MCDEIKLQKWAKEAISRRQFGVLGGAAAVAACTANAPGAGGQGIAPAFVSENVTFDTADGTMDAVWFHPEEGAAPAVIMWPDIASIREAKRQMAMRTAREGYSVLLVNPYYRDVAGQQFEDFADFIDQGGFQKVRPWRSKLSAEAIMRDTANIVEWLDSNPWVDTSRGIGAEGYCMGGPFTVWSTASVPSRVKAAASFHGGGLVRDDNPMSPHKLLSETSSSYLFAIAQDDDAEAPDHKTILAEAAKTAGRQAVTKVYAGDHGWTVPDSPAYAKEAAEAAWSDKLALYSSAL